MRCFTVTRGNSARFRVLPVIERHGWDPTFLCDTVAQKASLMSLGVAASAIVVAGVDPKKVGIQGVSRARDYVVRKLMPKGIWSVWIDDNVGDITGLEPKYSADKLTFGDPVWRRRFEHTLTKKELEHHIGLTTARANERGTIFCGFANETNYYFRGNRWQDYGYCRTQFALYRNDGSTWMPFPTMMLEDLYKSLDVVARYGSIVINRHVKPMKPMFEPGGIGSFERRLPWLQDNCKKLMAMYPGLVKYAGDGVQYGIQAEGFHLAFAKRSKSTVDQWRKAHGYATDSQG